MEKKFYDSNTSILERRERADRIVKFFCGMERINEESSTMTGDSKARWNDFLRQEGITEARAQQIIIWHVVDRSSN
ncbi:hypothetical protein [Delftia tsuruhatensis]|uniref:hypothetical protein n=1 Tax=Delftia tsuruhatensis TaxID=180282 RepID=UPI000AC96AC9|nr:hypothetical protein [Delftia tsuruhatensis]